MSYSRISPEALREWVLNTQNARTVRVVFERGYVQDAIQPGERTGIFRGAPLRRRLLRRRPTRFEAYRIACHVVESIPHAPRAFELPIPLRHILCFHFVIPLCKGTRHSALSFCSTARYLVGLNAF